MKLAAYVRVSTDRQAEQGLGPEVQEEAIRGWAKKNGHRIGLWTSDLGVSGTNGLDNRVGLLEGMGAILDKSVTGLVVYRLDRLARDLVLQESLLAEVWRHGARVFSTSTAEDAYIDPEGADADPSRALIRQILGAVGQYERAMIRMRLSAGKVRKGAKGGYTGGRPPFGSEADGGDLRVHPDEAPAVVHALELRGRGKSFREIAASLQAAGYRPRRSEVWHPAVVRAIILRSDQAHLQSRQADR